MVPGAARICALPLRPLTKAAGAGVSLRIARSSGPLVVVPGCCTTGEGWSELLKRLPVVSSQMLV